MSKRAPKLIFTEEELENPKLKKAAKKADKAAAKLDKAEAKIPKKKIKVKERTVDPATGKVTVRLHFEEVEKKPPSKLVHAVNDAPLNVVSGVRYVQRSSDDDNSGTDAANTVADTAEIGYRTIQHAYRSHKLKPYRETARAEKRADKANMDAIRQEVREEAPTTTNPYSRWQQKKAIRKEYIKAKQAADNASNTVQASEIASRAVASAAEKAKKTAEFIANHRKILLIIGGIAAALLLIMGIVSSCSTILQGVLGGVGGSTFQSDAESICDVESAYSDMEDELRDELENYESRHPGYDEYRISGEVLGHDPYVLAAILSALYGEYELDDVRAMLETIFDMQYELTERVTTETRYRTETRTGYYEVYDPYTGRTTYVPYTYEVQVPYTYTICTVTLTCTSMDDLVEELLTAEQLEMYKVYMETKGNYPDLFGDGGNSLIMAGDRAPIAPAHVTEEPDIFTLMKKEAEKYLGYPYVWGGASPSTSFDCSGYISWIANHSGWSIGRLTAQGLYNICTPVSAEEVQPGDLVFFKNTYATLGVSHVGLYAGNMEMIHAGDPISYADLTLSYWQRHFFAYGRLPVQ